MNAAEILSLLDSDPAAGILATADLIEQRAKVASSDVYPDEESWFRLDDKFGFWAKFASAYDLEAPHIVSWSPAPALAVAAWLRKVAPWISPDPHGEQENCPECAMHYRAVALCRAYLGGAP